jgi:hypothetical protein
MGLYRRLCAFWSEGSGLVPREVVTLAHIRSPALGLVYEACGRRGRYNAERLIAAHGADVKLPDLW